MTPASVHEKAVQDLQTLTTALPASSYKWTWGTTLTEEDVLSLYRSGTWPKNKIHSGYDFSLIDRRKLMDSRIQSIPTSKADMTMCWLKCLDLFLIPLSVLTWPMVTKRFLTLSQFRQIQTLRDCLPLLTVGYQKATKTQINKKHRCLTITTLLIMEIALLMFGSQRVIMRWRGPCWQISLQMRQRRGTGTSSGPAGNNHCRFLGMRQR